MIRKMIKIDEEKCNGCGLCVQACHEGAIELVNNKAVLTREDYCDGLGNCLPTCPVGAISFEEREAPEFNRQAAEQNKPKQQAKPLPCGCPGTQARQLNRAAPSAAPAAMEQESRLMQWPVQIKLVPVNAPYFQNANLLIAADCCAYAYAGFHSRFMENRITLIGCPKLDEGDYSEKLTAIIKNNPIKSVTVVKMEVPCCKGIEAAAVKALKDSGKFIPWQVMTLSTDGKILQE